MKKFISGLMVGVLADLIVNVFLNKDDVTVSDSKEARAERIASVLEDAWDEFGLFSFGIGDTDPVISIGMDKTKSEEELREYLKENIENYDLIYYEIEIFKKDIKELEKEHSLSLQNKDI
ncbi:hypothetical protein [Bacillus infantis]|uniref:hypothetical protein n=1 Tax=Bacillus infantis TaxID=324767 RepID=UPI00209FFEF3|nr:hypothetical protein [Bacillus infantis]MCP1161270.1 hypothetical protein [Bacillus infantis]